MSPDVTKIDETTVDKQYPLMSDGYLLFIGYADYDDNSDDDEPMISREIKALVMPEYNSSSL